MYAAFLLMELGQVFLNWVAGISGLIGFAVVFLLRVDKEERMILEDFGSQYRAYMEKTKRIVL
jgi:protein-S-isoprenylcysteine O-methyltransferase Ste14